MTDTYPPTMAAAHARIAAVCPADYARTRNALDGAVSGLSPYITHGFVSLADVLAGVAAHQRLSVHQKFVFELGWREYFRHVWQHRGDGILRSLFRGPLPDDAYARELPDDVRQGVTGVPAIDQAVRTLYATGMLHNHARMWLASYVVHLRRVHWRVGADWLYGHLLDGDLASNHLSWQWVAGTGSSKPYLFNADNVARFAPAHWHSPGTVIDTSYEVLDRLARQPVAPCAPLPAWPPARLRGIAGSGLLANEAAAEPRLMVAPPRALGATAPDAAQVTGRDVWLVHPWGLADLPAALPAGTVVIGLYVADYHRAWPWGERRWQFVGSRLSGLAPRRWYGEATTIGAALAGARSVRSIGEPHLASWLPYWADCIAAPALFAAVERRCDSFSQWWARATRGVDAAADLLPLLAGD